MPKNPHFLNCLQKKFAIFCDVFFMCIRQLVSSSSKYQRIIFYDIFYVFFLNFLKNLALKDSTNLKFPTQ